MNIKKISLLLIGIIPNAFLVKTMLSFLPDLTIVIYACLYMLFGVYLFKNKALPLKIGIFEVMMLLWIVLLTISVLYSPYNYWGLFKLAKLVFMGFGLVLFIKVYVTSKSDWEYLINRYLFTSFLLQICVIVNFISLGMPFGRFNFYGAHPIPLGMLGAVTAVIAVSLFIQKRIKTLPFFVLLFSSVWIVLISSSKGPLLSMLVGLIFLLPAMMKSVRRGIFFALLAAIAFSIISQTEQYESMAKRVTNADEDQSTYERFLLFNSAENTIKDNPILGGGIGVFKDYYPHNLVLEVLGEGGMLMGILLLLFFLWYVREIFSYLIKQRGNLYLYTSLAVLTVPLVVLMVSYTYVDLKFVYLGLGLMIVQNKINTPIQEINGRC